MSRFLFTTLLSDDLGLITRALPIAKELFDKGHNIYFVNNSPAPEKIISKAGLKTIRLKYILNEFPNDFNFTKFKNKYGNIFLFFYKFIKSIPTKFNSSTSQIINMDHFFSISGMLNKNTTIEIIEAYKDIMKKFEVDFVVDFWNPYSCIATKILGLPLITINQADVLPGGNGFIWWNTKYKKLRSTLPTINKILNYYKLNKVDSVEELLIGDLTLTMGIKETDPLTHSYYKYIGALLWQDEDITLPDWFYKLDEKPIIWVYSGNPRYGIIKTDFDSDIVIQTCIKYLENRNVNVILTTGHHILPKKYLPLPKNFYFDSYLPGLLTAAKCDLMIHHGGYGSCQTALYSGIPSLIIPTFSERESNARRITALGAGEVVILEKGKGKGKKINEKQFEKVLDKVLSDSNYKKKAMYYGEKLKSIGGEKQTLKLIEDFIIDYEKKLFNNVVTMQLREIDFSNEKKTTKILDQTILPLMKYFN